MDMQNEDGATPLMLACQQGNVEHVTHLLTQKVEVDVADYSGKTALHYCTENKDPACSQLILAVEKSLLDMKDNEGYSPLQLAVISGNIPMLDFLIDQGADMNSTDKEGHTAVHWATVCGHMEVLDFLHSKSANLECKDVHQAYPLHYAAQMCGNKEEGADPKLGLAVMKKLIDLGVQIDCKDQDVRTPLLWAASSGSSEACKLLVKSGANVESGDKDGLKALHCAASRGHDNCIETLINDCGALVDSQDQTAGCTPLFYAITLGHVNCTSTLLSLGADPSYQDKKGRRSPAHCAAAKGSKGNLDKLIEWKGSLWLRNVKGEYPINEAALSGQNEMVDYILNIANDKEKVNVCNLDGRTCLHVAAMTNNLELVKALVRWKANINAILKTKDQKEYTVLDVAKLKAHQEIVDYLLQFEALPVEEVAEIRAKEEEKAKEEARKQEEAEREKQKRKEDESGKREKSKSKEKRQRSREGRRKRDKDGKTKRGRSRRRDRSQSKEKEEHTPRTPDSEKEKTQIEDDGTTEKGDQKVGTAGRVLPAGIHQTDDEEKNKQNTSETATEQETAIGVDKTSNVKSDSDKSVHINDTKGAKQTDEDIVDNTDQQLGSVTAELVKEQQDKNTSASKHDQKAVDSSKQDKGKMDQKETDKPSSKGTNNQGRVETTRQHRKGQLSLPRQEPSGKQRKTTESSTSRQSHLKSSSQSQSPPRRGTTSPSGRDQPQKRGDVRKASPPRQSENPSQKRSPDRGGLSRQNTNLSYRGRTATQLPKGPIVKGSLTKQRNLSNRLSSEDLSRDSHRGRLQNGDIHKPLENGDYSETDMSSYSSYTATESSSYNTTSYDTSRMSERSAETPRKNGIMHYIQESVHKFEQKRYAVRELDRLKRIQLHNAHLSEEIILKKIIKKQDQNNMFKRKENYQSLADWERYLYEEYQSSMQPLQDKKVALRDLDEKRRIYEAPRSLYISPPRQGSTPRGPYHHSPLSPNNRIGGPGSVRSSRSRDRSKSPPRIDDTTYAKKWREMQDQKTKEQQDRLSKIYTLNLPTDLFDEQNRPISRRKPERSFPPAAPGRSNSAQELTLHRPKSRSSSPLPGKTNSSSFPHLATDSRTKRPETSQATRSSISYSNSHSSKSRGKKQGVSQAQFNRLMMEIVLDT